MSASSSIFSQVSGSASTSAGRDSGRVCDIEDSLSSVATGSEWSGPVTRNEKPRRSGSGNTSWLGPPSGSLSARGQPRDRLRKLVARGSPTRSGAVASGIHSFLHSP